MDKFELEDDEEIDTNVIKESRQESKLTEPDVEKSAEQ